MAKRVLIIDEVHPSLAKELRTLGLDVDEKPFLSASEVDIQGYQGLVLRSKLPLTAEFISTGSLEFIARAGAGLDLIDLEYCEANGIAVFSANEGNRDAVGEHVIGQLLSIARKINTADSEVRAGNWNREGNRGWELQGKTIGIIGYGNMGQSLAKKLQGFDMQIMAYDKYAPATHSLEDIFEQADILSLHVPLTGETRDMVNQEFISKFKKPFILMNSSRGAICSLDAILAGLQSGQLIGLALDVLPNEQVARWSDAEKGRFRAISAFPQTIFSPHVAGWTRESYWKINDALIEKIKAFYQL
ncbi:NAD(P)-dependent oxidoreductase [Aquirufa sp.]|jgi:D-3-phosphoglycerate dehydrogenase|uniref:NAD(P)-dependent oxidoreductase n=1 Tax=Aquirufa sp. TaxID=2676249 RepID=UPI0037C1255E